MFSSTGSYPGSAALRDILITGQPPIPAANSIIIVIMIVIAAIIAVPAPPFAVGPIAAAEMPPIVPPPMIARVQPIVIEPAPPPIAAIDRTIVAVIPAIASRVVGAGVVGAAVTITVTVIAIGASRQRHGGQDKTGHHRRT